MSKNIGREHGSDPHYRYKRQVAQAKIEGRGNGIKTNVVNNKEIARQLDRPPTYLLKFFGFELGAQTQYKEDTGLSIVNGSHTQADLERLVDDFIDQFVLCKSCRNPETEMKVSSKSIKLKCKACGAKSDVAEHRLSAYIYKHPPTSKESKAEKKVRKEQEAKLRNLQESESSKSGKKDKKDKAPTKKSNKKQGDDADDEGGKEMSPEGSANTQVMVNGDGHSSMQSGSEQPDADDDVEDDEDDAEMFTTDTSAAAAAARAAQQLSGAAASMVDASHVSAEEIEAAAQKERVRMLLAKGVNPDQVYSLLADCAATRPEQMKLLYELVLASSEKAHEAIERHVKYLTFQEDPVWQAAQLIGLELLLSAESGPGAELLSKPQQVKNVFMTLYNEDVLSGETIIYWFEKPQLGAKQKVPKVVSQKLRSILDQTVQEIREDEEAESDEDDEE